MSETEWAMSGIIASAAIWFRIWWIYRPMPLSDLIVFLVFYALSGIFPAAVAGPTVILAGVLLWWCGLLTRFWRN